MRSILTAQAGALPLALKEAGAPRVVRLLAPGVCLCEEVRLQAKPVFLRHLCPAAAEVPLAGEWKDVGALSAAAAPLLSGLDARLSLSVQTRIAGGFKPPYKRFDVNTALAEEAQKRGAIIDVKNPQLILSVVLSEKTGYIGLSSPAENLSDWAGGARRFKWEDGQVSRAEFKLLEALEVFCLAPKAGDHALDLGAAPGGWTRVLRLRGLRVTAVDPAPLDARIAADPGVRHVQDVAQAYFRASEDCALLVNDMKMDAALSARVMVAGATCLPRGGPALLTLKLPDNEAAWPAQISAAANVLRDAYLIAGMRQLFHNRNEVTAYLTRL